MLKQKPIRDKKYLRFLHDIGVCCNIPLGLVCRGDICGHHENKPMEGTMGAKVSDNQAVPLCFECHLRRHIIGRKAFWGDRTPLELADALWKIWSTKGMPYQSKLELGRQKVLKWRIHGRI